VAAKGRVLWGRPEAQPLDFLFRVVGGQVTVELGHRARIPVAHGPLNGAEVGATHEQEGGVRRRIRALNFLVPPLRLIVAVFSAIVPGEFPE
jgi:hypothetical protein